ncbi:MAG TPA: hypothetical protein VHA11_09165, partial [Bryobacteraceae bacterium]|nr:hypothetical protein [Bryobacteraceae bacterium]
DLIGPARVSSSAAEAREFGLLRESDTVSMNPHRLLGDAKALALAMAPLYVPCPAGAEIRVGGEAVFAALKLEAWTAHQAHRISDNERSVLDRLAYVLSGGRLTGSQEVPETYLLDLEREAFLGLCGEPATQQRMEQALRR